MRYLVAYDISTETADGRRRLRRVAQVCQNFGQRVQKSVFEVEVDALHFERLLHSLLKIIHQEEDSLRIYRLMEPLEKHVRVYGWDRYVDFKKPLLI